MKRNKLAILVMVIVIIFSIVGCKSKKIQQENAEQETTVPRNGIVLDEDTDYDALQDTEIAITEATKEPAPAAETENTGESGIYTKKETGDLIQPAGTDSAIEIP